MLTERITAMKLRSHEILKNHVNSKSIPTKTSSSSRFKKIFQGKNFFKKKSQSSTTTQESGGLLHGIPDYVRKSILRYLLESPPPSPPSSSPPLIIQQNSPSRNVRPPLMGIQALKNKKQQHRQQTKRPLRTRAQPVVIDNNKPLDDYPTQNNYDMTILHMNIDDDNDDNSIFASKTSTHLRKPIPQWARKRELQIAMCNQIYFHRNPSEIFGNTMDCSPAHLRTVLHAMLPNVQLIDDELKQSTSIPINSNKSILV